MPRCLLTRWEHTMEEMAAQVPGPRSESAPHDPASWRGRLCAGCPLEAECDSLKDMRSAAQLEEVSAASQRRRGTVP